MHSSGDFCATCQTFIFTNLSVSLYKFITLQQIATYTLLHQHHYKTWTFIILFYFFGDNYWSPKNVNYAIYHFKHVNKKLN